MADLTVSSDIDAFMAAANDAAARTELGLGALATVTPGTGVATALAVNVGSAGAPVLFNGAGGAPSSLTGTNITGTAAGLTAGVASAVAVGGITGLGTGVATALAVNVGTDGAPVVKAGALGTPSSGNLQSCTAFTGDTGTGGVAGIVPAPATGDATKFLKGDGTWASAGGGGLSNITETLETTSPNNTVNAESLQVTGGTTNTDLVLGPKGTGAFILGPPPDDTATGGGKRGSDAVDLAKGGGEGVADRVASGSKSLRGPAGFQASGANSVALLGRATSDYAVCMSSGIANGQGSFAWGYRGSADSAYAMAGGERSYAPLQGMDARSGWDWGAVGSNQRIVIGCGNKTTNNTPTNLFCDASSARLAVRSGYMWHGLVTIMGSKSDGSDVALYIRQVAIKNVGGTTALVGSVNTIGTDTAAGTSIAITADDTNDALDIQVTGISAETWRWMAKFDGVELGYGT